MRLPLAIASALLAVIAAAGPVAGQGGAPRGSGGRDEQAAALERQLRTGKARQDRFDRLILEAARRHRIPAALIKAVIKRESYFDPRARSRVGAQGLMQLMPATARRLGVADPFDPMQNIDGGTRYLSELARLFRGDLISIIASYNAGEHRVFARGYVPPFKETQNYVVRVLAAYVEYGGQLEVKPAELFQRRLKELKTKRAVEVSR